MPSRKSSIYLLLFLAVISFRCSSSNPLNLSLAKEDVMKYYESGEYDKNLDEIIEEAINHFGKIEGGDSSAVIFDVDDTALSNYKINKLYDFGYIPFLWDKYIEEEIAPAIPQVKNLYNFLTNKKIKIIFITGRKDYQHKATSLNLINEGYTDFDTLITRNINEYSLSAVEYKSSKRIELTKKGYKIIGAVGDQYSDLEGEFHGYQVKVPNYIYLIE